MNWMWLSIRREILLNYRKRSESVIPLLFFIMVSILFPLATTASPVRLKVMGAGVIWIAALLATLLSMNRLFQDDYNLGILKKIKI